MRLLSQNRKHLSSLVSRNVPLFRGRGQSERGKIGEMRTIWSGFCIATVASERRARWWVRGGGPLVAAPSIDNVKRTALLSEAMRYPIVNLLFFAFPHWQTEKKSTTQ